MTIEIFNNENDNFVLMWIEKDNKIHTMKFTEEKEAIEFCEDVLKRYDYRVTRFTKEKAEA